MSPAKRLLYRQVVSLICVTSLLPLFQNCSGGYEVADMGSLSTEQNSGNNVPTPTAPAAPSSLAGLTVSTTQINLAWTDNSNDENGFYVERSSNGSAFTQVAMLAANANSYASTGLSAGTNYVFRVFAFNDNGRSANSNSVNVMTQMPTTPPPTPMPPSAPTSLAATVMSTTQINLSWVDNANNELGFYIERSINSGSSYTQIAALGAGVVSYSDTSLSASTTYVYRVRAYNADGNSNYSNAVTATTQALPPVPMVPVAPNALAASVISATQINLSWADNSNNEMGFYVERSTNGGTSYMQIAMVNAGVTAYSNMSLTASTTYMYRVRAYNADGNSSYSNAVSATTQAAPPPPPPTPVAPSAPTTLAATTVSQTQVNLTWVDASDNETGFYVERAMGAGAYTQIASLAAGVVSYSSTGLTAGTAYNFRVRAYNATGNSNYSNVVTATTQSPPPSAPTTLAASVVSQTQLNLSWVDTSDNESGFYIERATAAGSYTQIASVAAGVVSYSSTGLTAATSYSFRVRAYNASGNSSYSNVVTATTQSPPPNAPTTLAAMAASQTQVNLTWADASDNESGFYIERATGSGAYTQIASVGAGITSYASNGLTAATSYNFRVRAYNATGNSGYSNVASATTQSPPPPPPTSSMKTVFMASGHLGRTVMSCDGGQTWIRDRSDNPTGRCWGSTNYVECDHTPISGRGLDAGDGYFYANFGWGSNGSVRRTQDGITWTTIRTGAWGGGVRYAAGAVWSQWEYNWARSTNMGQSWTTINFGPFGGMDHPVSLRAGNMMIAVGRTPGIFTSTDGAATWVSQPSISNTIATYAAAGNGIYLLVGGNTATRSTNGTTWSSRANAITGNFVGLIHDGTQFVGWTNNSRVTSADGITWSSTALNTSGNTILFGSPISYNSETRTYVAIPNEWDRYYTRQKALYSTDGVRWTELGAAAFTGGHPINDIAVGEIPAANCP